MPTGGCTVTPGYILAVDELVDNAKINQEGLPTVQVDAGAINDREVGQISPSKIGGSGATTSTPNDFLYNSPDFVTGVFTDGTFTIGSNQLHSATANFTADDVGRAIVGNGIQPGTKIQVVFNTGLVQLSQNALIQYTDGIVNDGLVIDGLSYQGFYSDTAVFTAEDIGRTVSATNVDLNGSTILDFVNATTVRIDKGQPVNMGGLTFSINGRPIQDSKFTIVGRGVGWALKVVDGVGSVEDYVGFFGGLIAIGGFSVAEDGTLTSGVGPMRLTITPTGDASWGTSPNIIGINSLGQFYAGAANITDAIGRFLSTGDFRLVNNGYTNHSIDTGCVNPALQPLIMSPSGGAIVNPTNVVLNCLTQYSRKYYRSVAKDGVTNTDTSFVSATAVFSKPDEGKLIIGTNIPATTYIKTVTNATTIVLTAATTGTGTALEFYIVPNQTDTLYVDGTPIILTATRKIAARAFKNGEYSDLAVNLFTLDTSIVPNPTISPVSGSYSTSDGTQIETLSDILAGSSIRYNIGNSAGTVPADPTSASGTLISPLNGSTPPSGAITLTTGTWVVKAIAFFGGKTDSSVITFNLVVSRGGGGGAGGAGGGGGGTQFPIRYQY